MQRKGALLLMVFAFAVSTIFYFGKGQERKQELSVVAREECNIFIQTQNQPNEHIIIREVFWSKKLETCLVVTNRLFPEASDWAMDYIKEKDLESYTLIEAARFSLLDLNKAYPEAELFSQTYQYTDLREYLEDPDKRKKWETDFLQEVQQYR